MLQASASFFPIPALWLTPSELHRVFGRTRGTLCAGDRGKKKKQTGRRGPPLGVNITGRACHLGLQVLLQDLGVQLLAGACRARAPVDPDAFAVPIPKVVRDPKKTTASGTNHLPAWIPFDQSKGGSPFTGGAVSRRSLGNQVG